MSQLKDVIVITKRNNKENGSWVNKEIEEVWLNAPETSVETGEGGVA